LSVKTRLVWKIEWPLEGTASAVVKEFCVAILAWRKTSKQHRCRNVWSWPGKRLSSMTVNGAAESAT
jgi:hypothetical protein